MSITMIGLDTAKSVFQVHGVDEAGKAALKRKLRRERGGPVLRAAGAPARSSWRRAVRRTIGPGC